MGSVGYGDEFCERGVQFVAVEDDAVRRWIQDEAGAISTVRGTGYGVRDSCMRVYRYFAFLSPSFFVFRVTWCYSFAAVILSFSFLFFSFRIAVFTP